MSVVKSKSFTELDKLKVHLEEEDRHNSEEFDDHFLAYNRSRFNADPDYDLYPHVIPGQGEIRKDTCGVVKFVDICKGDPKHTLQRFFQCHNYECPICYRSAAHKASLSVTDRLSGIERALRRYGVKTGNLNHFIITPAPGVLDQSEPISVTRKRYYDMAKSIGIIGGALWIHDYRIKKSIQAELKPFLNDEQFKRDGLWELVHKDVLGIGDYKEYTTLAGHGHVLGYRPAVILTYEEFKKMYPGWMYKVVKYAARDVGNNIIKGSDGKPIYSEKVHEPGGRATYLSTHNRYEEGKHGAKGFTYFGYWGYRSAKKISTETHTVRFECPDCFKFGVRSDMDRWSGVEYDNNGKLNLEYAIYLGTACAKVNVSVYELSKFLQNAIRGVVENKSKHKKINFQLEVDKNVKRMH